VARTARRGIEGHEQRDDSETDGSRERERARPRVCKENGEDRKAGDEHDGAAPVGAETASRHQDECE
jgi:hypothetical protein